MAEKRRNLALAGYDEIFGGNDSPGNDGTEKVQMISVKERRSFSLIWFSQSLRDFSISRLISDSFAGRK